GPEEVVGLCLDRSVQMMVGLLGILKAGGAYLPLDPAHPRERLEFILKDARARGVGTEERLRNLMPVLGGTQVVSLEAESEKISRQSAANPKPEAGIRNVAYVIYTSGSTGQPKGVQVEHDSVINLACALREAIYEEEASGPKRVSVNAPLVFDASVKQVVQ